MPSGWLPLAVSAKHCIPFIQRRANVFDVGPNILSKLYKCFAFTGIALIVPANFRVRRACGFMITIIMSLCTGDVLFVVEFLAVNNGQLRYLITTNTYRGRAYTTRVSLTQVY